MKDDQPSATARLIAAATVVCSRHSKDDGLVPPEATAWCERFLSTTWSDRAVLGMVSNPLGRALARRFERLTHPGIFEHYQLRKRRIEREWAKSRTQGSDQLPVLGAGLDTLGVRTATDTTVRVIEVDHPATQRIKREAVGSNASVRFVNAKLDEPGWIRTVAKDLDPQRRTFVVLEGVLMYLSEVEVCRLLKDLQSLPVPALRLAFTFMERWQDGTVGFRPRSRLVDCWLRLRGEPFRWWIATSAVGTLLAGNGWRLIQTIDGRSMGGTLLGESLAIAEREERTV